MSVPYRSVADAYPCGPRRLLIAGPPGTGKSELIAADFAAQALAGGAPSPVLVCSFTTDAADVIRARVARVIGRDVATLVGACTTIHAHAWRLVRALHPRGPELRVLQADLPASRMDPDLSPTRPDPRSSALRAWELARHTRVPLERVAHRVAPEYSLAALRAEIDKYESTKRTEGLVDYTDMLLLALELDAQMLALLAVDEAQDLTPLMAELVDGWADKAEHVVQIGDADQSIHTWCGADPRRLASLAERGYEVRHLTRSHRVPRAAHALAVPLIRLCRERLEAEYEPCDCAGSVQETTLDEAVTEVAAAEVSGLDVLVLARSCAKLGRWAAALHDARVPYVHERGPCALGHPDRVSTALAVLRLRQRGEVEAGLVAPLLRHLPVAMFDGSRRVRVTDVTITSDVVTTSWLDVRGVRIAPLLSAPTLARALELAGLGSWAASVAALLDRHGERPLTTPPRVALTTMHASKGREARLVVVDLGTPRLVRQGLADGPSAVDLERRLLYVALTRTRDRLLLIRDARHDLGEQVGLRGVKSPAPTSGVLA